jgi:CheY-like chemotaxis protein
MKLERLAADLGSLVPEVFHPAAIEWLNYIAAEDLPSFLEGLNYSIHILQTCAEQLESLKLGQRTKKLILHNDDERGVRAMIEIMLSREFKEHIQMISVEGSAEGLILARTLLPDLIITDVSEPGIDGFTFAKYLKKNAVTQDLPLMFLTARGDPDSVRLGRELGAGTYLSKPIRHRDLLETLRKVMGIEV